MWPHGLFAAPVIVQRGGIIFTNLLSGGKAPAGQGEKVFVHTKTQLILLPHQLIHDGKWENF
tara:strand:+ start:256 stop:441 length:186 start_codon:yes stop_codon:yes gene_type:complete